MALMVDLVDPALRFTRDDYDRLPEDLRVELIGGELLKMPAPTFRHQQIVGRLFDVLRGSLEHVFIGPVGFGIGDAHVLVPDLIGLEAAPPDDARDVCAALVVMEVLSPSTARRDRTVKADLYLEAGVREVWLLGERRFHGDEPAESGAASGLRIVPRELFR